MRFPAHFQNGWSNYLTRAYMVIMNTASDLVEHFTYSTIVTLFKIIKYKQAQIRQSKTFKW